MALVYEHSRQRRSTLRQIPRCSRVARTQFMSNGVSYAGQMLIPIYLIRACGRSPSATGWLLAPLGVGMICSYPRIGALTQRFGIRKVSAGGAFLALARNISAAVEISDDVACVRKGRVSCGHAGVDRQLH